MLKADYTYYTLKFTSPAGTSRGTMHTKNSWFIRIWDTETPHISGIGECGLLPSLSPDNTDNYEETLKETCDRIEEYQNTFHEELRNYPSIRFGVEIALTDLVNGGKKICFPSAFTDGNAGIPINGLIWMDSYENMESQIDKKLANGFQCLKIKIGALDWDAEYELIRKIRQRYSADTLEIRTDANGAFSPEQAPRLLELLAKQDIHSIEQPITSGQHTNMANLCENTPVPIALDEELIGITSYSGKEELISHIKPQYIILKPSLTGGYQASEEWITLAGTYNIGWWITSALESNIGLNAIAQWTFTKNNAMAQGLGTGQIYTNNFPAPLFITHESLYYDPNKTWDISAIYG